MKALEANEERFALLNTVALGLSIDTVPSKNAWAQTLGIQHTPLVCDFWPHGKIAKAYGLFRAGQWFFRKSQYPPGRKTPGHLRQGVSDSPVARY